jgi:anti-sigma regulatory factor (Ser/Thr protein kinase)
VHFRDYKHAFRPRARTLLLLGDQLIRDAGIAVFELVKNAYDADSPNATIIMEGVSEPRTGKIVVEDSGTGMDYETVVGVWLEPGTDYRVHQRTENERTSRYKRTPLGEKGVGRFAAHKLGREVVLTTRKSARAEVVVEVDWARFESEEYLADVQIRVRERGPEVFKGTRTGTRIEISELKEPWTRGMVRELARSVNSICSPFQRAGEFTATLSVPDHPEWLEGLLTVETILDYSLFRARCRLRRNAIDYDYKFTPFAGMRDKVKPRSRKQTGLNLASPDGSPINLEDAHIGPVDIDLYIFDRDPKILSLGEVSDRRGLKEFLDESGGIRVYRNGIRVYDYGEPGNDWLNLGGRRVNVPARRISNNLVVGAVELNLNRSIDLEKGVGLVEKTNREGFVDNRAFRQFRDAVSFAVAQIETERNEDKTHIRNVYSSKRLREPVVQDLEELRELIRKKKLTNELGSYLDRIETDFQRVRDTFLASASAGLSLSVVIHEVEKGITELVKAVEREKVSPRVKTLAKHIADLIEGFGALVRRSGTTRERASSLVAQALFNTDLRLKAHGVAVTNEVSKSDFDARCSRRLVVSTLMNLIDNSIWWLDNKWGTSRHSKRIFLGTSKDLAEGPAIVVADNGPGFLDPPEYLVEPFITRKPDGMGLGLHIADQAMKVQGGKLVFPEQGDLSLPPEFNGAVVALAFGSGKK